MNYYKAFLRTYIFFSFICGFITPCISEEKIQLGLPFDTIGYRVYHDMDNERNGSKLRMYIGKNLRNSKLKIAYERKRTGAGLEAGTFFIDQSFKF